MAKRRIKIVFATDLHGSEVCFRKTLNLADSVGADAIVFGGDLTGKALVPLIAEEGGPYRADFLGEAYRCENDEELAELEKRIRFNGFYPVRLSQAEYDKMRDDEGYRSEVFTREMKAATARWIEIGEEKLAGSDRICVTLPGNDDEWAMDEVLNQSSRIINSDGKVLEFDGFAILGLGVSTPTPWNTPREVSEETLAERLGELTGQTELPVVGNIHVPPFDSTLDVAPKLTDDLEMVKRNGAPVMVPVGSTAVRQFLEEQQIPLALHGHVHESKSQTKIGSTFAINPGSDYASGTLQAAIVTLDLKKNKVSGHQFVSG
jgi:Icc-related predicted phosphoesterase